MSAWAKLKPAASSTPGRTRGPANAASRAKSPRASRRASPGTTKAAGRCTRPSQGGGELGVADGGRRGHVDRPADAIGAQQEPDRGNLVRQGNPAPVLLARPEVAAEPQPEYRQHLSERPAVTSQNDLASEIDHPRTGGARLLRRVLPRDAGVGQETGPCWPGSLGLTVCCTDPPTPSSSSSACERPCGAATSTRPPAGGGPTDVPGSCKARRGRQPAPASRRASGTTSTHTASSPSSRLTSTRPTGPWPTGSRRKRQCGSRPPTGTGASS